MMISRRRPPDLSPQQCCDSLPYMYVLQESRTGRYIVNHQNCFRSVPDSGSLNTARVDAALRPTQNKDSFFFFVIQKEPMNDAVL